MSRALKKNFQTPVWHQDIVLQIVMCIKHSLHSQWFTTLFQADGDHGNVGHDRLNILSKDSVASIVQFILLLLNLVFEAHNCILYMWFTGWLWGSTSSTSWLSDGQDLRNIASKGRLWKAQLELKSPSPFEGWAKAGSFNWPLASAAYHKCAGSNASYVCGGWGGIVTSGEMRSADAEAGTKGFLNVPQTFATCFSLGSPFVVPGMSDAFTSCFHLLKAKLAGPFVTVITFPVVFGAHWATAAFNLICLPAIGVCDSTLPFAHLWGQGRPENTP
ncbi:hypothetical protein PAXRUDRAFT_27837 [Paxillus rubicundulus Ve08.2h10]|uniref:Uncharacterized protein n=1 Tax=Paxillus rubicundulus Ve08.2h10 TaxID=930991 RepID=A0A0D0DBU4_9AGAM|nr:hypothetical protein PAXRUDRAFT_27837 [Paxillus rubicundulus Ve08.2h10]